MYNKEYYEGKKSNIQRKFVEKKEKFVGDIINLVAGLLKEKEDLEKDMQIVIKEEGESLNVAQKVDEPKKEKDAKKRTK